MVVTTSTSATPRLCAGQRRPARRSVSLPPAARVACAARASSRAATSKHVAAVLVVVLAIVLLGCKDSLSPESSAHTHFPQRLLPYGWGPALGFPLSPPRPWSTLAAHACVYTCEDAQGLCMHVRGTCRRMWRRSCLMCGGWRAVCVTVVYVAWQAAWAGKQAPHDTLARFHRCTTACMGTLQRAAVAAGTNHTKRRSGSVHEAWGEHGHRGVGWGAKQGQGEQALGGRATRPAGRAH